jgi:hypothetical protein
MGVGVCEKEEAGNRESFAGSSSSLTVGDTAWVRLLRLADSEDDILLSIRLALLVFFSAFSSLRDDVEPAVGGGERPF